VNLIEALKVLSAILPLFELDKPANPLAMMQPEHVDHLDPQIEADYMQVVRQHQLDAAVPARLLRSDFYQRAGNAFLIVVTAIRAPTGTFS
jgi:L-fucose mutarotase